MLVFIWGAVAALNMVAGLLFMRFWHQTRERLFAILGAAFLVFALNYVGLAAAYDIAEDRHWVYGLRLLAFMLIITGIVDKNLRPK